MHVGSEPCRYLAHKSDHELLEVFFPGRTGELLAQHAGRLREIAFGAPCCCEGSAYYLHAAHELLLRADAQELGQRDCLSSPAVVRSFLRRYFLGQTVESFVVLALDAQNRLIRCVEVSRGTLTQTSVYPREVLKLMLACHAAGAIFAHNHPSCVAEPSRADEALTAVLKAALATVDIAVLDHIIVAGTATVSFAERGLL